MVTKIHRLFTIWHFVSASSDRRRTWVHQPSIVPPLQLIFSLWCGWPTDRGTEGQEKYIKIKVAAWNKTFCRLLGQNADETNIRIRIQNQQRSINLYNKDNTQKYELEIPVHWFFWDISSLNLTENNNQSLAVWRNTSASKGTRWREVWVIFFCKMVIWCFAHFLCSLEDEWMFVGSGSGGESVGSWGSVLSPQMPHKIRY